MKLQHVTLQGVGIRNEDALIINQKAGIYGVIDGVSSLVPYTNERQETGGYIAANLVRRYFDALTECDCFSSHLTQLNRTLRQEMELADIDITKKESLWGAAVALVKLDGKSLHFLQTGDCMIFAVYSSGKIRPLTHPQTDHIEAPVLKKWADGIAAGLTSRTELYQLVKADLIQNRQRSNQMGGYGVLNGEEDAELYFESGRISLNNITHLVLLTDGLFMPTEKSSNSWEVTVRPILEQGLEEYALKLILLEDDDPECVTIPRFKKSDDKTGIVIHL